MADVTLTVHDVSRAGLDLTANLTMVVPANTYYFPNDGQTKLFINATEIGTIVVTFDTPNDVDGLAIANRTVNVESGKYFVVGPWPKNWYNDGAGRVKVTFSLACQIVAFRG